MLRVGHKGADALVPGNTLESFAEAVRVGVDAIEFDVLPLPDGRVVIAHDFAAAERPGVLGLDEALEAFRTPPLDGVSFDCDMKLPGAEEQLVESLRRHDLVDRAMTSGTYLRTIRALGELEPGLSRGWTVPRVRRDWTRVWWARPALPAAVANARRRLPKAARRWIPELGVERMWVFDRMISRALVEAVHSVGAELIAWTVDDPAAIEHLTALGVDGICSNDPRLLNA